MERLKIIWRCLRLLVMVSALGIGLSIFARDAVSFLIFAMTMVISGIAMFIAGHILDTRIAAARKKRR